MKKFTFLIVLLILIVGGVAAWWINGNMPVNLSDKTVRSFTVNRGDNVRQVANNLKADGFIKDPIVFFLLVRQEGVDGGIQAGDFQLAPAMAPTEIITKLQVAKNDISITIPEGKRAEEVADILKGSFDTYEPSWRTELIAKEGYLFPDTYSFSKEVDIATVITKMTDNFNEKYASIPQSNRQLSQNDLVIIASIVEREAKLPEDRPLVASVIFNRLNAGMTLGMDATVQYTIGSEDDWWPELNNYAREISPESPYNTYTNPGLPPTPISNPGLDVLTAVVTAPETKYLYYITDPKTGKNVYTTSLEEHNKNIEKYGI